MSREFEDFGPRPPRRNKPGSNPPPLPDSGPNGSGMGPSTFRPNPVGSGGSTKPRAGSRSPESIGNARKRNRKSPRPARAGASGSSSAASARVSSRNSAASSRTYLALRRRFLPIAVQPGEAVCQDGPRAGDRPPPGRHPTRFDAGRRDGRRAADVQPDVPQHDQGRRGTRRGARDLEDARGRHYEARQRLIRQARSAMIYPVVVLTVAARRDRRSSPSSSCRRSWRSFQDMTRQQASCPR